jgi:hypothetical protein
MSIRITARTIRAAETHTRYFATTDQGGRYDVIAYLPEGIIVRARRTGALGLLVRAQNLRTGHTVHPDGLVRARIDLARDTGDAAGTLVFGETRAHGEAPAELFTP